MVTIQSQNFGVEIEMTGISRGTAASVIANYFGVGGIPFAGGTYQTYEAKDSKGRVWKCMRDGSGAPLYYLPVLLGASLLTGAVTGVAAACLFRALRHTSILR